MSVVDEVADLDGVADMDVGGGYATVFQKGWYKGVVVGFKIGVL